MATGYPDTDKSQVIDVTSSTSCSNLPLYPSPNRNAVGGVVNDTPTICGGYGTSFSPRTTDACYLFDKITNSWKLHCIMKSRRNAHATTVVKDALFITGGYDGSSTVASTEFCFFNGTTQSGVDLPAARHGHCMVTLHDGRVIIMGSSAPSSSLRKNVIIMDPANDTYTTGPSLNSNRIHAGCVLFNSPLHSGRPVVLAAGGEGETTSEVFDYTNTNQWQTSISLINSDI